MKTRVRARNRFSPATTAQERNWSEDQAMRCFLRAAAALDSLDADRKASALILGGMAMLHLAASDPEGAARDRAIADIEALAEERRRKARGDDKRRGGGRAVDGLTRGAVGACGGAWASRIYRR
jgi:hypothetical protein